MPNMNTLDITPTPRILRTLGEIPFQTWQCVAELIDNSIDAFLSDKTSTPEEVERRVTVTWASDSVAAADRILMTFCGGKPRRKKIRSKVQEAREQLLPLIQARRRLTILVHTLAERFRHHRKQLTILQSHQVVRNQVRRLSRRRNRRPLQPYLRLQNWMSLFNDPLLLAS